MTQATGVNTQGRNQRWLLILLIIIVLLILLCLIVFQVIPQGPNGMTACLDGPYTTNEAQDLTFNASCSTGPITSYSWEFGDGGTGYGVTPTHAYQDGPGDSPYWVVLTVGNDSGETAITNTMVMVNNLPPMADADGPYICYTKQIILLNGRCTDPSPVDQSSLLCTWTDLSGKGVVNGAEYTCPNQPGILDLVLTVTDKDGASDESKTTVEVRPGREPPIAVITIFLRDKNGWIYGFNGTESRDPDGEITDYQWDFGDGQTGSGEEVIHEYAASGTYTVTLEVTDNSGQKASTSVSVTVPKHWPMPQWPMPQGPMPKQRW